MDVFSFTAPSLQRAGIAPLIRSDHSGPVQSNVEGQHGRTGTVRDMMQESTHGRTSLTASQPLGRLARTLQGNDYPRDQQ